MSSFDAAEIPDVSSLDPESNHWFANYVINSALRGKLEGPLRPLAHNLMRRAEATFQEHHRARTATYEFLESENRQSVYLYAEALLHWEFFLGQAYQAYMLVRGMVRATGGETQLYDKRDGSPLARLASLRNSVTHAEDRIAQGRMPEVGLLPVWLTNQGIKSMEALLTYAETGELLVDIRNTADLLVDPRDVQAELPPQ